MRYPNVRFADPVEFSRCCAGHSLKRVARMLRHDESTVQAWLDGKRRIPWWAPDIYFAVEKHGHGQMKPDAEEMM